MHQSLIVSNHGATNSPAHQIDHEKIQRILVLFYSCKEAVVELLEKSPGIYHYILRQFQYLDQTSVLL